MSDLLSSSIMLVALLIVSFISCSLAQTPECDAANQTLRMDSDCYAAVLAVCRGLNSTGNATAVMMVCGGSTDTTCNQKIRAYLDNCPVSMSQYVSLSI